MARGRREQPRSKIDAIDERLPMLARRQPGPKPLRLLRVASLGRRAGKMPEAKNANELQQQFSMAPEKIEQDQSRKACLASAARLAVRAKEEGRHFPARWGDVRLGSARKGKEGKGTRGGFGARTCGLSARDLFVAPGRFNAPSFCKGFRVLRGL